MREERGVEQELGRERLGGRMCGLGLEGKVAGVVFYPYTIDSSGWIILGGGLSCPC